MNWQPRFIRAVMARLHLAAFPAPVPATAQEKSSVPRHTAPGFGTLVIGNTSRERPGRY